MDTREQMRYALARAGVLVLAGSSIWVLDSLPPSNGWLRASMLALLTGFCLTILLPRRWQTGPAQLALLAVDLTALCAVGCILVADSIPGADARIAFVSAYLVATLVAIVGQRTVAGFLAALGGTMILGVGTAMTVGPGWTPQPVLLGVQVLLLLCTSFLTVWIAGSITRKVRALELDQHVQREIRQRESAAAELVSFAQALADSSSLTEIAEAVLRHLRCHTQLSARAVVLESEGEDAALWEEAARLDADGTERRRLRLQESLSRVGSQYIIRKLQCHATSVDVAEVAPQFKTAVDIPVKIDGRVAGVLLLADPAPAALPPDRIGVLVDVARRTGDAIRRLERLRDHENRRTALLLRQMREGVLLLGGDGSVLLANPSARKALKATAREDGHGSSAPRLGDITLAELADTPPGVSRRFRATFTEPGREHPFQLACTAISVLDRGHRIGTLVTLSDVTEEEQARNRIIQAEKMTLVGQTLAGVAHELNNPLAALIGYADLLRGQELPADVEKPVHQMREQALRATRIVRNLLNFARRRNPERVPTSLTELIEGTAELFAYEARLSDTELDVRIQEQLPAVLGDKHALQQILVNLVQNSLHAMEDWKGQRTLRIVAEADESLVTVSVSDTGPGIPEELRSRVFESFFTTKGSNKGTGLGLALSRSIARDHGGDLLLAPDTGSGASFTIRLPRHAPGQLAPTPLGAKSGEERLTIPQRILVVDDEASVRETLVAQLGGMGARVDSAGNATEAQSMVRRGSYDALVVDIRMPGKSGLEFHADLLETNPFLAERIVFITGDFVNDELLTLAGATGRLLLEKPFTMTELAAALHQTGDGPLSGHADERLSA